MLCVSLSFLEYGILTLCSLCQYARAPLSNLREATIFKRYVSMSEVPMNTMYGGYAIKEGRRQASDLAPSIHGSASLLNDCARENTACQRAPRTRALILMTPPSSMSRVAVFFTSLVSSARPIPLPCCPLSNTSQPEMTDAAVLDSDQAACFDEYLSGRNLGIFSCAGSGKSVLLRAIIRDAVARGGPRSVAVCSWYGAAADLVGGSTLSSFFGCGIWLASADQFLTAVKTKTRLAAKLKDVRVLVVDEVFTVTAGWFIVYLKLLRGLAPASSQQHAAGGVQVIRTLVGVLFSFSICSVGQ